MTRKHDVTTPATGFTEPLRLDRIGIDALRALDALEEQLFGMDLERIVTVEAINAKRQRLTGSEDSSD